MEVRSISGHATFDLTSPLSAEAATRQLLADGAIVILQRANITVPMNSLNLVQAREVSGNLGLTTYEFLLKDNFLSAPVGEVLFRLHPRYTLGTSKLLVPVPRYEDTEVRKYGAYVYRLVW